MLTSDALKVVGIREYGELWRGSGKVVEKARQLLQTRRPSALAGERRRVRLARDALRKSVFYRQLDIMAYRLQPPFTQEWQANKSRLLARGMESILDAYRCDCDDRMRLHLLQAARKRELMSGCRSHLNEINARWETYRELHAMLLCQVLSVCPSLSDVRVLLH